MLTLSGFNDTEVADRVSFTLILKHMTDTFVASSVLVSTVTWVHAVDGFTRAVVNPYN